jgi:ubiquinone/menaquinone biosynthesis C-methylase UbiE
MSGAGGPVVGVAGAGGGLGGGDMSGDTVTTPELDETRAAWDRIAPGYDEFVTPTGDWALPGEALQQAGLRRGMRFLDVASGSGALSLPAARLGAEVTAVDLSAVMVERLHARARQEGLTNVEGEVMDGHDLRFGDDTFDLAGSQFGVMLFPDLPRGLSEMVRVTKPEGRVLMVTYGDPSRVEFLTFFLGAMQAAIPGFTGVPMDPPPLPFQVADPDRLRTEMVAAGLTAVRVEAGIEPLAFESAEHMWAWVTNSNPIGAGLVADLSDEQRAAVRQVLDGMLREHSGGGPGASLTAGVNIAVGTKPGTAAD